MILPLKLVFSTSSVVRNICRSSNCTVAQTPSSLLYLLPFFYHYNSISYSIRIRWRLPTTVLVHNRSQKSTKTWNLFATFSLTRSRRQKVIERPTDSLWVTKQVLMRLLSLQNREPARKSFFCSRSAPPCCRQI